MTLRWELVDGAIGYLVHRAPTPGGPFAPVDHGGRDVLAVPGPVYCDTTGKRGEPCWYAVASLTSTEATPGELSEPVAACPLDEAPEPLDVLVRADRPTGRLDPVWRMIGSEHLSFLLSEETVAGHAIGEELAGAFRLARTEIGADRVRAHSILHDELRVYREEDGEPVYDFSGIERTYDRLLELGLRPVVEVSFMPHDLATDPEATIFEYRGIISPPRDWARWGELNRRLAAHLVERYGVDEISRWGFEIWNEANLEVFWTGTRAEYFRLYDVAARAIKSVDERLRVGGPSTAAAGWIADFLDFVVAEDSPLDFLSTHTYGNLPLDVGCALEARGLDGVEVWWTEWGTTPTHFNPVSDSAWAATFVLHGMKSAQGRADALAFWVVSDHFEELGRPPALLHGGFGLLTVGNLRKPRWWALALAEALGEQLVELDLHGDGAGSLVDGWAARRDESGIDLLLWNGTLEQARAAGDALLNREVRIVVAGLRPGVYDVSVARVDEEHSNLARRWHGQSDWPSPAEWEELRRTDRLDEEELSTVEATETGDPELTLRLPMPGVARMRFDMMPPGHSNRQLVRGEG